MKYLTSPSKILGLMGSLAIVLGAWTIYNRYSTSKNIAQDIAKDAGNAYRDTKAAFTKEDEDKLKNDVKSELSASLKAEFGDAAKADQNKLLEAIDGKIAELKEEHAEEIAAVKATAADAQKCLNEALEATKEELAALKAAAPQDSFTEAAKNKLNNTYKQAEDLAGRYNLQRYANLIGGAAIAGLLLKVFYFTK